MRAIENFLLRMVPEEGLADPLLRVSLSRIFIIGGFGHFFAQDLMLSRIEGSPWQDNVPLFGEPWFGLWASGLIFILAGTSLALGWTTRLWSLFLLLTLVPITLALQLAPWHIGPLFTNLAIMGALGYIFLRGRGRYALNNEPAKSYEQLD